MKVEYKGTQPQRARGGDSGYDMRAKLDADVVVLPQGRATVSLGTRMVIPNGYAGFIIPRSGLAARHGITISNTPGLIDSNFRGEVMAIIHNTGTEPFRIEDGDRIAQLVIVKVEHPEFVEVDDLGWSDRNQQGFGSSGIK